MVSYEVTLELQPELASAVEDYTRRIHIPDVFATGCFREVRFSLASPTKFRTSYVAAGQADLDRYLRDYAADLRAEFLTEFPDGVTVTRETWVEREVWPPYVS